MVRMQYHNRMHEVPGCFVLSEFAVRKKKGH